jgi:hypothetical protein
MRAWSHIQSPNRIRTCASSTETTPACPLSKRQIKYDAMHTASRFAVVADVIFVLDETTCLKQYIQGLVQGPKSYKVTRFELVDVEWNGGQVIDVTIVQIHVDQQIVVDRRLDVWLDFDALGRGRHDWFRVR